MTTIATTGMAQLTTNEKQFKANIEAAIDGAVGNNTLTSAHIFVGNASNVAADVEVTGTLAITNAGVTSLNLASGKQFIGDTNGVAQAVTISGPVTFAVDGTSSIALASAKMFVGDSNGVAQAVTPTGVVDLSNAGAFTWDTAWANVATTSSNGELTIPNMTSNGGVIVLPRADVGTNGPITHQTAAAGKVTLFYNGTTNVAASLSVAYIVCKL